ncbi:MAG TPA: hypothetical protein VF653_11110 [Methylomirabilota bacterium]
MSERKAKYPDALPSIPPVHTNANAERGAFRGWFRGTAVQVRERIRKRIARERLLIEMAWESEAVFDD